MQSSQSGASLVQSYVQMMTSFQENTHLSIWQMCQSLCSLEDQLSPSADWERQDFTRRLLTAVFSLDRNSLQHTAVK